MQPSDSRENPIVDTAWFPWVLTAGLTVAATCIVLLVRPHGLLGEEGRIQ